MNKLTSMDKAKSFNLKRSWIISIGIFLLVQVIFFLVDGTVWEPNINDSNDFFPRMFRSILDWELFTEWFTPYSYPFFNMAMFIHITALVITTIADVIAVLFSKK
ncbi:YfzA family protein [Terribacillus saccharophilus]|uniref:YfzA family protein n=1 Tax=Terribacillus saccharophilus TaxID=361277 RepID=UPI0039821FC7